MMTPSYYDEGWEACCEDLDYTDCPYVKKSPAFEEWMDGYEDAFTQEPIHD